MLIGVHYVVHHDYGARAERVRGTLSVLNLPTRNLGSAGVSILRRARGILARAPGRIGYGIAPRVMSEIRKRWVLVRHPHATITFDGPVYLGPGFSLHIPGPGTFTVGPGVEFRRNFRAEIVDDGRIIIGAGTTFTYSVLIQCSTSIEIGERCVFAEHSSVFDGSHRFRDTTKPMLAQGYDVGPVRIGDDAAIMAKCTVLTEIGNRAFVGANAVVTRPIPPYTVAVGVPAKPVDYFGPPGGEPPDLVASGDAALDSDA